MKFNPLEWSLVHETFEASSGVVQLRSSAPFGVTIEAEGVEAAAGYAAHHRLALPGPARVTVTATAPVFRKDQPSRVYRPEGEVFTNIDRMPHESGTVAEVTKAMRLWKLEQRALMRQIREERAALDAARANAEEVIEPEPRPEAKPKPKPEAKPEPASAPEAKPEATA